MTSFAAIGNMDVDAGQFCDRVKANLLSKGRIILSLLTFLMISLPALPQSSKTYLVKSPNNERLYLGEISSDSAGSADIAERLLSYRNEGHLLADINSIWFTEDSLVYEVYLGEKYYFTFIDWDKFPQNFISLAGVRSRRNRYSPRALNKEIGRILTYSGEIGYPFAAVKIDSAEYKDGLLGIQLLLDSGPKITYDSLKIDGIRQTRMSFLQNWLSVQPGSIYQQSRFAMIERRINDLNFLTLKSTPSVAFVNNRARISLELEEERVNTFDGVIGFLQNQGDEFFEHQPKILRRVKTLHEVGLGYISLGQHATTLSGGEAQRVKLATELSKKDTGQTLYILDEPTTGLHFQDIQHLLDVLNKLVDKGNTVLIIEHNMDVIKVADHIVDLGPEGGDGGGNIVAAGTPEKVAKVKDSYTGQFLKEELV